MGADTSLDLPGGSRRGHLAGVPDEFLPPPGVELPELLGICDRIYAMSAGRITGEVSRADATPERLMQYMTKVKEQQLR